MYRREAQSRLSQLRNLLDPERARRERQAEQAKGLLKGLALGGVIGGLAGIFFAPDKGENTRQRAKEELDRAKAVLGANIELGKEKVAEFVEEQKEVFGEKMVTLKEKLNKNNQCCCVIEEEVEEAVEALEGDMEAEEVEAFE